MVMEQVSLNNNLTWRISANTAPHEPGMVEITSIFATGVSLNDTDGGSTTSGTAYVDGGGSGDSLGWTWENMSTRVGFTSTAGQVFTPGSTVFYDDNLYMCRVGYTTTAVFDDTPDRDDVRWKLITM